MEHKFERLDLRSLSDIRHEEFRADSTSVSYASILLVKFIGEYRIGSAGNPDAYFMHAMLQASIACWEPIACILDLSDLHYEWGDMMEAVIGTTNTDLPIPLVAVVGPNCAEAVRTLVHGVNSTEPLTENERVFLSLDLALEFVERELQEWSERPFPLGK